MDLPENPRPFFVRPSTPPCRATTIRPRALSKEFAAGRIPAREPTRALAKLTGLNGFPRWVRQPPTSWPGHFEPRASRHRLASSGRSGRRASQSSEKVSSVCRSLSAVSLDDRPDLSQRPDRVCERDACDALLGPSKLLSHVRGEIIKTDKPVVKRQPKKNLKPVRGRMFWKTSGEVTSCD
jgi:hypothetical protein